MKNTITQLFFEQFLQKIGIDDMRFWKYYLKNTNDVLTLTRSLKPAGESRFSAIPWRVHG